MRILVVVNTFPPFYAGGAEISAFHTSRALLRHGHDVNVLVLSNRADEGRDERYSYQGLPVRLVHRRQRRRTVWGDLFDPVLYSAMLDEIEQRGPDMVHIHNVSQSTLAPFVAAGKASVPTVNTLHDLWLLCPNNMRFQADGNYCSPALFPDGCGNCFKEYDYWAAIPNRRRLMQRLTQNVSVFLSPSQAIIERHVEAGYDRERFRLLRLGFEQELLPHPSHEGVKQVVESRHRYQTLMFAGGGTHIKGASVLVEALPRLLDRNEKLRVVVAGGGDRQTLDALRRFEPRLWYLGHVPFQEMSALFGAADLTLQLSICHENSPVVIFESYGVGTPVVASRIGGIPELVDEGRTGFLFTPANVDELVERVERFFEMAPNERRRMRQNAVRARQALSMERHVTELQSIYATLVRAARPLALASI